MDEQYFGLQIYLDQKHRSRYQTMPRSFDQNWMQGGKLNKHEQISHLFYKANKDPCKIWPRYRNNADADWITTESGIPWLKLHKEIPTHQILAEIKQAEHLLINHRDEYNEHRGWRSFCLHGKSLKQTQHCEDSRPFQWVPEIQNLMPKTVEFFRSWAIGNYERIRVMALQPKGYIALHRDLVREQESNFLTAINIAITQPDDCHFIIKDWGQIPFSPGDAYMPDINNWHAVFNHSEQTRYHIIVHSNNWTDSFKETIRRSYDLMHGMKSHG